MRERGLGDIEQALGLLAKTLTVHALVSDEGRAMLNVVERYILSHTMMSEPGFSITVVWSDIHMLEIEISVRFDVWAGGERAYVSREQLASFADAIDRVAGGATEASVNAGQPNLGYGKCRIFEYSLKRRLGMEVVVGNGGGHVQPGPDFARELRVSIPIERGPLPEFARSLRAITLAERGSAFLPALIAWSW